MAITYEESGTLMADMAFRNRVKVACLKYADFITLEPANTPAHATRVRWAQATQINPDGAAGAVTPVVVMDPVVQDKGAAVTDAELQSATEASVNKVI